MAHEVDDGGPAFPTLDHNGHALVLRELGMTLRDWLAGQALAGMCANGCDDPWNDEIPDAAKRAATICYGLADAMIAARKGGAS